MNLIKKLHRWWKVAMCPHYAHDCTEPGRCHGDDTVICMRCGKLLDWDREVPLSMVVKRDQLD